MAASIQTPTTTTTTKRAGAEPEGKSASRRRRRIGAGGDGDEEGEEEGESEEESIEDEAEGEEEEEENGRVRQRHTEGTRLPDVIDSNVDLKNGDPENSATAGVGVDKGRVGGGGVGGVGGAKNDAEPEDAMAKFLWKSSSSKKPPMVMFQVEHLADRNKDSGLSTLTSASTSTSPSPATSGPGAPPPNLTAKAVGEKFHLTYKFVRTECRLLRTILHAHGFKEVHPNSNDFNLLWTGCHLKPYTLRGLQDFQKVNHFPRSYEITRKDHLVQNIQRMQQNKGFKHFDFIPQSFVLPSEFQDFCSAYLKNKGVWIVKPIASSRGRGIFLVTRPEHIPLDEPLLVSRYVSNPLLVDGFKFDLRIYVAVTSYDPLVVYIYEEGLARFATVKYDKNIKNIRVNCMHLTNYSINKRSMDYVKSNNPDVEDYGNKWTMSALLRFLRTQGYDTTTLMMKIEDIIIKTIVAAEMPIATASKMFVPHAGNCFEIYGFDILIDETFKPWLLEVNLSPSLACDAPLDNKVKSHMICDLLNLCGFQAQDPMQRRMQQNRRNYDVAAKAASRAKKSRPGSGTGSTRGSRPLSAGSGVGHGGMGSVGRSNSGIQVSHGLQSAALQSYEEAKLVRRIKEEHIRCGGWVRVFPSPDSWELYSHFLDYRTSTNLHLHEKLYPERHKIVVRKTISVNALCAYKVKAILENEDLPERLDDGVVAALERSAIYERKLSSNAKNASASGSPLSNNDITPGVRSHLNMQQGANVKTLDVDSYGRESGNGESNNQKEEKSENGGETTCCTDQMQPGTETEKSKKPSPCYNNKYNNVQEGIKEGRQVNNIGKNDLDVMMKDANLQDSYQQQTTSVVCQRALPTGNAPFISMIMPSSSSVSITTDRSLCRGTSSEQLHFRSASLAQRQNSFNGGHVIEPKPVNCPSARHLLQQSGRLEQHDSFDANIFAYSGPVYRPDKPSSERPRHKVLNGSKGLQATGTVQGVTVDSPPLLKCEQLISMLESGMTLNKIQARQAFSMYLQRVQQRLLQERMPTTDKSEVAEPEDLTANEQMDLVLRFLKRAASNLHVSNSTSINSTPYSSSSNNSQTNSSYQGNGFRVVIPSRKLPLTDRKRILAKQLGDFVNLYNRETDLLDKKLLLDKRVQSNKSQIPHDQFEIFLSNASESDLEDLLTTYTRLNKSASIFLGGASGNTAVSQSQASQSSNPTTSGTTNSTSKGTSSSDSLSSSENKSTTKMENSCNTTSVCDIQTLNETAVNVSSPPQLYTKPKTSLSVYTSPTTMLYSRPESGTSIEESNTEISTTHKSKERPKKKGVHSQSISPARKLKDDVGSFSLPASNQRVSPIGCENPESGHQATCSATPKSMTEPTKPVHQNQFLNYPNINNKLTYSNAESVVDKNGIPFEREPPEGEDSPQSFVTTSLASHRPINDGISMTNQQLSGVSMDSWRRAQSWAAGLFKTSDGKSISRVSGKEGFLPTPTASRPCSTGEAGLDPNDYRGEDSFLGIRSLKREECSERSVLGEKLEQNQNFVKDLSTNLLKNNSRKSLDSAFSSVVFIPDHIQNTYYVGPRGKRSKAQFVNESNILTYLALKESEDCLQEVAVKDISLTDQNHMKRRESLPNAISENSSAKLKSQNEQVPKSMLIKLERALLKQQVEQSRQLTELNKAKHQAMVARAHKQVGVPLSSHISTKPVRDHRSRHKSTHTSSTVTITTTNNVTSSNSSLPEFYSPSGHSSKSIRLTHTEADVPKGRVPTPFHSKAPNSAPPSKPKAAHNATESHSLSRQSMSHTSGNIVHTTQLKAPMQGLTNIHTPLGYLNQSPKASNVKSLAVPPPSPYLANTIGLPDRSLRSWSMSLK